MSHGTAVSPLMERGFAYVRSVRALGAGNGPTFLISRLEAVIDQCPSAGECEQVSRLRMSLAEAVLRFRYPARSFKTLAQSVRDTRHAMTRVVTDMAVKAGRENQATSKVGSRWP